MKIFTFFKCEPVHEIFNNVECGTSNPSDQPAHTRSLIRAFASRFQEYSIIVKLLTEHHLEFLSFCQNVKLLEISCHGSCIIIELTVWQENFAHFMFVNSLQPVTNNFCFSMGVWLFSGQ